MKSTVVVTKKDKQYSALDRNCLQHYIIVMKKKSPDFYLQMIKITVIKRKENIITYGNTLFIWIKEVCKQLHKTAF